MRVRQPDSPTVDPEPRRSGTRAGRSAALPAGATGVRLMTPETVLRLQATAGNRAVSALLQEREPVQRTIYKFKDGAWVRKGLKTGDDRYPHPNKIVRWSPKPADGDRFNRKTGMVDRDGEIEHVFTPVGATKKKDYGAWYGAKRQPTAYGFTTTEGRQGPHAFAHIGKRSAAEASMLSNRAFNPANIRARTGVLPSAGQARNLLANYEKNTGVPIEKSKKRSLDEAYKGALKVPATAKSKKARNTAVVRAMELNPLATYSHGTPATDAQIAGKGEDRTVATGDLGRLASWNKGDPRPALDAFDPGAGGFDPAYTDKYLRDIGGMSRGEEELSDLELSSADEYSEDEEEEGETTT